MIILNYRAALLLHQLDVLSTTSNGFIEMLNEDGYWISANDTSHEFAFMFEDKLDLNFPSLFPIEWANIQDQNFDIFTDKGHFLVKKVNLLEQIESMNPSNTSISMHEHYWWIVSYIPNSHEYNYLFSLDPLLFIHHLLQKYIFVLLFVSFLSAILAILVFTNERNFSNVKFHSTFDGLTRILNRRAGLKCLDDYLQLNQFPDSWVTLCYMDINGLKEVNDRLGHAYGDILIQHTTEIILSEIRETDLFMRLGGDEFLLVLTQTKYVDAQKIWERVLNQYSLVNQSTQFPFVLSVSHGLISKLQKEIKSIDEFINEADQLMYAEKRRIKRTIKIIKDDFQKN